MSPTCYPDRPGVASCRVSATPTTTAGVWAGPGAGRGEGGAVGVRRAVADDAAHRRRAAPAGGAGFEPVRKRASSQCHDAATGRQTDTWSDGTLWQQPGVVKSSDD